MATGASKSLESHPILGSAKLRQVLSKTRKVNTLMNAVKRFQDDNGIKMDTLPPALQLLDLHKIKRRDFYEQAASDISEHVVARIRALGENGSPESLRKLEDQLEKCFDLFHLPQFRNIVLENLKQIPNLKESYLDSIMADREFYDACPLPVKQQIWLRKIDLFKEAYRPFIDSYLKVCVRFSSQILSRKKEDLLLSAEPTTTNFFTFETTKARRQWKEIKDLITFIGNHEELFNSVVAYIRELFAETGDSMLCSLRYELIMAAHDVSIEGIVKTDPCHDFAWCLEACMRDKHLESHQTNRLRHILDSFAKSSNEVRFPFVKILHFDHYYIFQSILDLAMIAGDVHVVHFLCSMTVRKLRDSDLASKKMLPTDVVDAIFVTKFLPEFTSLMVEDCIRAEIMRSNTDFGEDFIVSNYLSKPSDRLITFLKASRLASLLWYHCCLDMLPSKKRIGDLRGVSRYVEALPFLRDNIASTGVWCQLLFQRLLYSNQYEAALVDPVIYGAVIDQVLLKNIAGDRCAKYQLLKLISQIGYIWGQPHCMGLMKEHDVEGPSAKPAPVVGALPTVAPVVPLHYNAFHGPAPPLHPH
ncbi:unnamed protein product [Heligmosomoides polygyrus]|uniref:Cofactor of BRCA1 n=1 Tax=Heligmosomoides polygyrus TaxID=6339 RepID=A0A3P8B416_HELPZ|nr:unnamed protein product [Heligmosomoides polygyrus]